MKIAYFDAPSGISGDMTVGALLDAGGARLGIERLRRALSLLPLGGYEVALERVEIESIRAASFKVAIEANPDAGTEQRGRVHQPRARAGEAHAAHGHAAHATHVHDDHAEHAHSHRHSHTDHTDHVHADAAAEHGGHVHRDWKTIRAMIEQAGARGLGAGVVERAVAIFSVLADAEGRVHGVAPDEVHFHEVGATDSIVDIVATAWCLDELGIEACFVGPLPSGSGIARTQHGLLPIPAPATVALLRGFEVVAGDGEGELVTPTGAAILSAMAKPLRPVFRLDTVGAGAGTWRLRDRPNVLRVLIGDCDAHSDEQLAVIEADIDDMTPAALAHVADRLRHAGARDVTLAPIVMKKGRAGMRLTVLSDLDELRQLADVLLSESTTIGVRYRTCGRVVLARRIDVVETSFGSIALKVVRRPNGEETAEPELDDLARAAVAHSRPLAEVRAAAIEAWERARAR